MKEILVVGLVRILDALLKCVGGDPHLGREPQRGLRPVPGTVLGSPKGRTPGDHPSIGLTIQNLRMKNKPPGRREDAGRVDTALRSPHSNSMFLRQGHEGGAEALCQINRRSEPCGWNLLTA